MPDFVSGRANEGYARARTRRRRSCLFKPRHSPQPSGARSLAQSTQDAEARRHTQRRARPGKQTRRCGRRRRLSGQKHAVARLLGPMKVLPAHGVVRGHAPAASSAHTGGAFKAKSPCASAPLGEPGAQLSKLVAVAHQVIQLVWCVLRVHDVCVRVRTREAQRRYACHACGLQKMPTHTKAQSPATPNDCQRAGASTRSLSLWRRHLVDPEARGEVSIVCVTLVFADGVKLRV